MQPFIGISCNPKLSEEENLRIYGHYFRAVKAVGGNPCLISSLEASDHLYPQLDGLVLPGGCDVSPHRYGEEPHPLLETGNPPLDELEFQLFAWALQDNLPVLGICRGMQIINISLGGTLYQDLGTQFPESLNHRMRGEPRAHRVFIQAGSRMEQLLEEEVLWTNSRHHQAVRKLGKGVRITGFSEDGVAELCEVEGYRLIIGAQAHPEEICTDMPVWLKLFSALVEESSRTRTAGISYQLADID